MSDTTSGQASSVGSFFLVFGYGGAASAAVLAPALVAELAVLLWLLLRGVDAERWEAQAASAARRAAGRRHRVKAVVQERYGDPAHVLRLADEPEPSPGPGEVLVRVQAAAVAGDDWHLMRGIPYVARTTTGLRRPKVRIPGRELAGIVETLGDGVEGMGAGDQVFGWGTGTMAQHAAVPAGNLVPKPSRLSPEEAAVVPISGFTALQALRDKGAVQPGEAILVIGASGGVGTFAVQIARALGAEVTGVCGSENVELVRSLGAGVIDYRTEDFAAGGPRFDVIVDLVGSRSISDCRRALLPGGRLVMVAGTGGRWLKGTQRFLIGSMLSPFTPHHLRPLIHKDRREDLVHLAQLIELGTLTPVLGARYQLPEVVDAIGHFAAGHGAGKVSLAIG